MKSIWKIFLPLLLLCLNVSAEPLKLDWKLCKGASIETRDGKQYLLVVVRPVDVVGKLRMNCAKAKFNLAPYAGSVVEFKIRARAKDVSKPRSSYNGVKFMLNFTDKNGKENWDSVRGVKGSFDWQDISFLGYPHELGKKSQLMLGLQDSSGEVEFDLSSLRVTKVFAPPKEKYTAVYSEKVAATPQFRGVMSPNRFLKAEDFDTLKEWNVNLVRAQIMRNWLKVGTDRDLKELDAWINNKLDNFEKIFPVGYQKGIRFVIDLHTYPGGRYESNEQAVFHEKEYADYFIAIWKKIAERFKDNPAVWAYDLINEPNQLRRAPYDYWNLQRLAAEAIREIDPERPIIVESNGWDSADHFYYLAPLKQKNIIYQVHMYDPSAFTHQGVHGRRVPVVYPGVINGVAYNREKLKQWLAPVLEFQKKYRARIYVGEFSAAAWAPGAEKYLADCISIFEEYGWDWTYHSFRESPVWSLEHEGENRNKMRPSADNPRKRVLLEGFKNNLKK